MTPAPILESGIAPADAASNDASIAATLAIINTCWPLRANIGAHHPDGVIRLRCAR